MGIAPLDARCKAYWPGHSIHVIHARHGAQSRDWGPARVVAVDGNYIVFVAESGTWRRWNHGVARLRRIAETTALRSEAEVEWCEEYYLLKVGVGGLGYLFSLAESGEKACGIG